MNNFQDLETLNNFNWYYKDLFIWKSQYYSRGRRIVFFGEKIDEPKFIIVLKKIKVENNYEQILREVYFLSCCQKSIYFIKLIDIFLSDDKNYIFLILKDEGVNLSQLIDYTQNNEEGYDYTQNENMIKWIIFQIICGLYILHKSKLVHYDIKPGNILISKTGDVKIADFGSVNKEGSKGYGTLIYESPDIILRKKGSEKVDMWAVGVIMIELYRKKYPFFCWKDFLSQNNDKNEKILQLKSILSKYKININNKDIDINNDNNLNIIKEIIKQNNYELYKFKEELKNIDEIKDQDAIDLIKKLLKINPLERITAEEALNSKYLSKFKNNLQQCAISYKIDDYEKLLININNKDAFIKNIELIKQKFIGEVLFK